MLEVVKAIESVPKLLLDDYSLEVWFNITHSYVYICLKCVHPDTFEMKAPKFMRTEEDFHMELNS